MDLPKTFDEFVDARKQGFIRAKEFKIISRNSE